MTAHPRITTPFTRESTTDEVLAGIDLTGQRAIVTGGASGIGAETARALASAGAEVTLAVRNSQAGDRAAAEMRSSTGNSSIFVASLDLADRASIAAFVAAWHAPLHVLVNSAEAVAVPRLTRTAGDWELHFATNHLGHFELAIGLHDALATSGHARHHRERPELGRDGACRPSYSSRCNREPLLRCSWRPPHCWRVLAAATLKTAMRPIW